MSHGDSAILLPTVSILSRLKGKIWIGGEVAASTKHNMVANLRTQVKDEKLRKRSLSSNDQEVILNYLRSNITPPCSLPEPCRKEHGGVIFERKKFRITS